ncbi:hypothetical protein L13192_09510 [Pyrenophora tritici-repentis]|nr:hypothetical protein L13192_09510 [Pyrenophora tritici-repentis]
MPSPSGRSAAPILVCPILLIERGDSAGDHGKAEGRVAECAANGSLLEEP